MKQAYETPQVRVVALAPKEAVLSACKTADHVYDAFRVSGCCNALGVTIGCHDSGS